MGRVNRVSAYHKEKKIDFSTSSADPLASWRISGIKGPVFEQWYFDSVADDGQSGIVFTLARDASYAMLGQGHLRVELDVTFSDGTHFNHVDWSKRLPKSLLALHENKIPPWLHIGCFTSYLSNLLGCSS